MPDTFTFTSVTRVTPSGGTIAGGTAVTITGFGFDFATGGVTMGGSAMTSVVVVSNTSITAVTPAHNVGAVDVVVAGVGTGSALYTYQNPTTKLMPPVPVTADGKLDVVGTPKWLMVAKQRIETAPLVDSGSIVGPITVAQVPQLPFTKIDLTTSPRLLGRTTAGAGAAEEIEVAAGLTLAGGVLGLTGLPGGYVIGDLLYADSANSLARLADVAVGSVLVSGGVATAPAYSADPSLTSLTLSSRLVITQGTLTADTQALSSTATWNNAGVVFTHWKANITNTLSAALSKILDLQIGSSSVFAIDKTGRIDFTASQDTRGIQGEGLTSLTTGGMEGLRFTSEQRTNATSGSIIGGRFVARVGGSTGDAGANAADIIGVQSEVRNRSVNTVPVGYAYRTVVSQISTGKLTTVYGYHSGAMGGNIDTKYAFFAEADSGANVAQWAYYADGTQPSRFNGSLGIGLTPTARLHLAAGTAAVNTAPLKLTSGTLLSSGEAGAVEFLTDDFYATITTGAARKPIVLADVALTSAKLPGTTTNGRLVDGPGWTGTSIYLPFNGYYAWTGRAAISSTADGVVRLANSADNNFTALHFGGSSSSFPSIRRSGTILKFRLSDDSADSPITVSTVTASALTSGRVVFAGASGLLSDDSDLTFATDTLTATKLSAPTSVATGTLAQTGKTTTYNNIATAGWGVPAIYGSGRSTAQVAAVASVATYTMGAADGSVDVSANVNVTTSTTHNFAVQVAYTDETNTARTLVLTFSTEAGVLVTAITNVTGAGIYDGFSVRLRCKASTAITVKTAGTFTTVTYNVEADIQQVA